MANMANTWPQLPFATLLTLPASAALSLSPSAVYTHFTHAQQLYTCVYVCMWLCTFCYARSSRGSKQLLRLPRGCHFCLCCCCCAPSVKTAPKAKWGNFHLSYAAAALLLRCCYCGYEYETHTHTHTRAKPALLQFACFCMCVFAPCARALFGQMQFIFQISTRYLCTSTTQQQQRHTQTYMHT